jgi:uncharacterized protein
MNAPVDQLDALGRVIERLGEIAVAVSGGVDSLTLATLAQRRDPRRVVMFHAVSPAVPQEATERVRLQARRQGWVLRVIDAGEFADRDYRANPLNRCFYCKTNLYGAIAPHTRAQIVSGTNLDDLGEYRPGLAAAKQHAVRHPFVEAGVDKACVRAIARQLGLGDIAELPAAPCLSSRIETGIAIDPAMLSLVHETERLVTAMLHPQTVRCRVRAEGVVIELDNETLAGLGQARRDEISRYVTTLFAQGGFDYAISFAPYRVGSAFIHISTGASV